MEKTVKQEFSLNWILHQLREEVKEYDYALRQIQYYLNNAKISYQRIKALLDVYKRIDETDFTDTPQTDDDEHEED